MAHHRCTRCKQESDIRHKHVGGVYCDSCLRWIRGFRPHTGTSWLGSVFSSIWDMVTDFATSIFRHKTIKRVRILAEKADYSRQKAAIATMARSIPYNPEGVVPQKG